MKVVHTFTIPKTLLWEGGPAKVGFKPLSSAQELLASKLGRFDVMKSQYEAVKLSLAELDGKAVTNNEGDVDQFWEKAGPKLRTLMLGAYNKMATPSNEEDDSFFKSEAVNVAD
jgi:hypothetical protein